MKKIRKLNGFTLVELLIVIALIAILSVGVLATINPIEQRNKAADANTSNDAGEVLGALERHYTNASNYPWMEITGTATDTVDKVFYSKSNEIGMGLCTTTGALDAGTPENTICSGYDEPGILITTDELKASFLQKYYGIEGNPASKKLIDALYLVKEDSATGNSIYVCYIPKAKANRTVTNALVDLQIDGNGRPTARLSAAAGDTDGNGDLYFSAAGVINAKWDFLDPTTSLFKCIP